MGNTHHHHHHTEYVTDPALQKQIDQMREQNKKLLEEIKKSNDPEMILKIKEDQLQNYLSLIKKQKWTDPVANQHGIKHNVIVGNISVGKSSLLNSFYDLQEPVGVDETTMEATPVIKGKITIWDSPGINEEFDLYDAKTLKMFAQANKVFMLFNTSLKSSKNQLRILHAANPKNLYIIRTQIDRFGGQDSLDQALQKDKQILKAWGIDAPVYATSAQNESYKDYQTVKMLMNS